MTGSIVPPPKAIMVNRVYYYNCRGGGMTALLAGPFVSAQLAEQCGEYVGPQCVEDHPETKRATFGVVELNAPGNGPGHYNHLLPEALMGELLIDTGFRSH
jgi:hypothetical protein